MDIYDNFLSEKDFDFVYNYCVQHASYSMCEIDTENNLPTGLVCPKPDLQIRKIFSAKKVCEKSISRLYINCFSPGENPTFHIDSEDKTDVTGIFYIGHYDNEEWHPNHGGCTEFFDGERVYGVPPIKNRYLVFPSNLYHRATSFKNKHRFTIAVKYT